MKEEKNKWFTRLWGSIKEFIKNKKFSWVWVTLIIVFLILNIIYMFNFIIRNGIGLSSSQADFGYYGSFIGGIIGAFAPLITVLILVETLNEQKNFSEKQNTFFTKQTSYMKEQEKSLKKQISHLETQRIADKIDKFESRLMLMLRLHRDNVDEMMISENNRKDNANEFMPIKGRNVFVGMIEEYREIIRQLKQMEAEIEYNGKERSNVAYSILYFGIEENSVYLLENELKTIGIPINSIKAIILWMKKRPNIGKVKISLGYSPFQGHQQRLGHYFRQMWQIIKFIDNCDCFTYNSDEKKYEYSKMLRAQLSNHEQALLAINALSPFGRKAWKESGTLKKYQLIRNISKDFFKSDTELNLEEAFKEIRWQY